jgi:hypothetical protein
MAIYIVVPLTATSNALNEAVESSIPQKEDRYQLQAERGWLIKFDGTSIELSNKIGVTGQTQGAQSPVGTAGPAIIVPIPTYYGRGPGEMWEWLKTRIEQ